QQIGAAALHLLEQEAHVARVVVGRRRLLGNQGRHVGVATSESPRLYGRGAGMCTFIQPAVGADRGLPQSWPLRSGDRDRAIAVWRPLLRQRSPDVFRDVRGVRDVRVTGCGSLSAWWYRWAKSSPDYFAGVAAVFCSP